MIIRGANSQQSRHECLEVTKIIFSVGDWLKGKMVEEIDITNISYKIPKRNLIAYPVQVWIVDIEWEKFMVWFY